MYYDEDSLELLTKPWQKFFRKFDEVDELSVSKWKDVHLLGYICKRFFELHRGYFSVTIDRAPSKSPDMYIIKRMRASLGTTNIATAKEYIDWVYDNKIIPRKVKFRKVGFFLTSGFVNEFAFARKNKKVKEFDRSEELPGAYKEIAEELGINGLNTYGDLAFVLMAVDRGRTGSYAVLVGNLELVGLDLQKLRDMK